MRWRTTEETRRLDVWKCRANKTKTWEQVGARAEEEGLELFSKRRLDEWQEMVEIKTGRMCHMSSHAGNVSWPSYLVAHLHNGKKEVRHKGVREWMTMEHECQRAEL